MILLFVLFFVGMILFHAYHVMSDKSNESGAGEILSSSTICFRSSILSVITLLTIFLFVNTSPDIQKFIIVLLVWQTIFSIFIVLILLLFGLVKMKNNSAIDYQEAGGSIIFGIVICLITLIFLGVYHFVYREQKEVREIK